MKKAPFRHFSNTDHARNSASAVLDSYNYVLTSGYENILDMGSCTDYDAKALAEIIMKKNPGIKGLTTWGRNYNGNFLGGSGDGYENDIWRANKPIGWQRWVQSSDNNIVDGGLFHHPASQYLNSGTQPSRSEFDRVIGQAHYRLPQLISDLNRGE